MKKITFLMSFFLLLSWQGMAQISSYYTFSESTATYTPITGGTVTTTITGNNDDGEELNVPIGFTFKYAGTNYTTLAIGVNGAVNLVGTDVTWTNNFTGTNTNNTNIIAPLWDDLNHRTVDAAEISYITSGVSPSQTFTVQWKNISWNAAGNTVNFQLVLHEGSNNIQFNYGVNNSTESRTASIGFNKGNSGSDFISVTPGTPATSSFTSSNNSISSTNYPGNGKVYLFTYTPPACPDPTSLTTTNITATSANLTWTENGSATTWDIEYGVSPYTFTGTPTITGTTSNPHNLTGLTATTSYEFYVRTDCGVDGTSAWVGPYTFTTACAAVMAPWSENFDAATTIPSCWKQGSANLENWIFANTAGHIGNAGTAGGSTSSGNNFAYVDDSTPDNVGTTLETPLVDVSGLTTPMLSFFLISNNEGYSNVTFSVDVFDGAAWNVDFYTSNTNTANGEWEAIMLDLSTLTITGAIQARFIVDEPSNGDFYDDIAIDDVSIAEAPSCIAPTSLSIANLTATSADLGWTSSATTWDIEYGVAPYTFTGTPTITGTTSNPHNLTGLTSGTSYVFYVRTDCGVDGTSTWTGPYAFATNPDYCAGDHFYDNGGATGDYSNNVTNETTVICPSTSGDVVTVTFNSFNTEAGYDDLTIYNGSGTSGTSFGTFDGTTIPGPFTSTDASGCLTFVFNSDGSGTRAGWDATITCTPPPTCPQPSALAVTNITGTTVDLAWTENGAATTWDIEYGVAPYTFTGTPTITGTTSNPHNLTGLTASTSYEFYVRADCGVDGASTWAGPYSFTTACVAPIISTFPWTENFDGETTPNMPCGWVVDNVNADAYTWETGTDQPSSGANAMQVRWNSAEAANDWAFTPELQLTGSVTYQLSFAYSVAGGSFPEKLKVMYGATQNVAGMTNLLFDSTLTNTTYQTATALFTPPTTGSYYVGFHDYSNADMFELYVDDVTIDIATSVNESATTNNINIYPNPTTGIFTITGNVKNATVNVMSITGKTVYQNRIANNNSIIDLSNNAKGLYFVAISTENGTETYKVIVQ